MLALLFRVVGIDLDARIARIKHDLDNLAVRASDQVKHEVKEFGITAALLFAGLIAVLGACIVFLIALYVWIDRMSGPLVALATVGCTIAVVAAILFAIAVARGQPPRQVSPAHEPDSLKPEPVAAIPDSNFASVLPPPTSNLLYDRLAHRVSQHAAGAADEALSAATNLVSKGSRGAVLGTIILTAVVGIAIGRHRR